MLAPPVTSDLCSLHSHGQVEVWIVLVHICTSKEGFHAPSFVLEFIFGTKPISGYCFVLQ